MTIKRMSDDEFQMLLSDINNSIGDEWRYGDVQHSPQARAYAEARRARDSETRLLRAIQQMGMIALDAIKE